MPNAFPFKEQVLAEKEELRRRKEEERERKRRGETSGGTTIEIGQVNGNGVVEKGVNGASNGNMEGYVRGIQIGDEDEEMSEDEEEYDSEEDEDEDMDEDEEDDDEDEDEDEDEEFDTASESSWNGIAGDSSPSETDLSDSDLDVDTLTTKNTTRNSQLPLYMKAINRSSLIVFVLDARCPNITRSPDLEQLIQKKDKKCIFVLNRAGTLPIPCSSCPVLIYPALFFG